MVTINVPNSQNLQGTVTVTISGSPAPVRVEYYIDGVKLYWTKASPSFPWSWDTTQTPDGSHTLSVVSHLAGKATTTTMQVVVANGSPSGSAPANTGLPVVTGAASQGATLSCSQGSWSGGPTSFAYQWRRGATPVDIAGATSPTYVVTAADVGATLRCKVTAFNSFGSASSSSAQTAVVTTGKPANTVAPSISGTPNVGATLTGKDGSWAGSPTSFSRKWKRADSSGANPVDIAGQTGQTYVAVAADNGHTIRFGVIATNANGPSPEALSAPTAVIGAPPPGNAIPISRFADMSGAYIPNWQQPVSGRSGHFEEMSTPYGPGFKVVCYAADNDPTIWPDGSKAILGQRQNRSVGAWDTYGAKFGSWLGAIDTWTGYVYFPSSGNANGFPSGVTNAGLLFEHHTATVSGQSFALYTAGPGTPSAPYLRGIRFGGTSSYTSYYSSHAIRMDAWLPWRQVIKWSYGSDGYTSLTFDGETIIPQTAGPTLINGETPRMQFGYYAGPGSGITNTVYHGGIQLVRA